MRITDKVYEKLLSLFDEIDQSVSHVPSLRQDIDLVEAGIVTEADGNVIVSDEKKVRAALTCLINGRPDFNNISALINSAGIYHSPASQGISDADLKTLKKLVRRLVSPKPTTIARQQKVGKTANKGLAVHSVYALKAGGEIRTGAQTYERPATGRDLYDRSPTLRHIPPKVLKEDASLMRYLLTFRDRIAVENLRAMGKLGADEFLFSNAHEHYALVTLVNALCAGSSIDSKTYTRLHIKVAGPLGYFMKRRDIIEPELRRIGGAREFMKAINKSVFPRLNDTAKRLSDNYIRHIVKWGRWFLTDPDVAIRSIYTAEEIAFMFGYRDMIKNVPGDIAGQFENAAYNAGADPSGARREAVMALKGVMKHYDHHTRKNVTMSPATREGLKQIRRLVEWNTDALDGENGGGNNNGHRGNGHGSIIAGFVNLGEPNGSAMSAQHSPATAMSLPLTTGVQILLSAPPLMSFHAMPISIAMG